VPDAREELRQDVALMRELGVIRWKNILLGPPVQSSLNEPPKTPEELKAQAREERRAYFENLFNRQVSDQELDMLPGAS
jgi:hypothetical protein